MLDDEHEYININNISSMSKVAVRRRIKAAHIATEHAIPTLSSYISVEYLVSYTEASREGLQHSASSAILCN